MKGYRKICEGTIRAEKASDTNGDYADMDQQIRIVVHSGIVGEVENSGCQDFYVVVYKKVAKK
jgi:hypothetical protein